MDIKDIIENIISFLLGLLSVFIIDFIRLKIRIPKRRKMVENFLNEYILDYLPKIVKNAEDFIDKISNETRNEIKIPICISFNTMILDSVSQSDYYLMFKKDKYLAFVNIYSLIKFFENNMPYLIHEKYVKDINDHIHDANEYLCKTLKCDTCEDYKKKAIKELQFRISELKTLESEIHILSQNKKKNNK
jgi:predicted RNA-binding protein with RPS1 domain